jgi:lipoprotein-anchoring transpeptidase ErfK/SrfK
MAALHLAALVALLGAAISACANGSSAPTEERTSTSATTGEWPKAPSAVASVAARRDSGTPLVSLDGTYSGLSTSVGGERRIYARSARAWIHAEPRRGAERIGYLRAGASSPTSASAAGSDGCAGGWYPIEPRGFLCAGPTATFDAADPAVTAALEHPPDRSRKLPYIYGTVRRPGPIYLRLPTGEELHRAEPDHDRRMQLWLEAPGEVGAGYAQHVWSGGADAPADPAAAWRERRSDPVPRWLQARSSEGLVADQMKLRVGYSLLHTFLHEGRRYGVTTDLRLVATDRLRPIQGSEFRGVRIGKEAVFPFAFVRRTGAKAWRHEPTKNRLEAAIDVPYRAVLALTGKQRTFSGRLHYETTDNRWINDLDASRLDAAKRMPAWGKKGEKWIDVNITKQTLVLYEGTQAVYATLMSSGEAGLADHEGTTATKRGIFRIHTKHLTATMSSDELGEEFELRDVPYVQYFDVEGYALHGAYWHDRFGTPKSHGCLNLSPEDARRIFHWTEPALPAGWHGVLDQRGGTILFVHQ